MLADMKTWRITRRLRGYHQNQTVSDAFDSDDEALAALKQMFPDSDLEFTDDLERPAFIVDGRYEVAVEHCEPLT